MVKVPFFDWAELYNERGADFSRIMNETLSRGAFILQKDVVEFEANLAAHVGVKYAVGLSDGTNAILLGLRASGIGAGDEVIIAGHSFIAAAQSIHFAGATPVPVELDEDDWLISPEAIEAAITPRTRAGTAARRCATARAPSSSPCAPRARDRSAGCDRDPCELSWPRRARASRGTILAGVHLRGESPGYARLEAVCRRSREPS